MNNRGIEIPKQVRRLISAYGMRAETVSRILEKQGISENDLVNYLFGCVTDAAQKGLFFVKLSRNEDNVASKVLFDNFSHYMVLTRRFREYGYTVTPSYTSNGDKHIMTDLTISWGNATEKL